MMSPLSGWVQGAGALLASPALYAALVDGTMSLETAGVRLAVATLVSWVGLSMLGSLLDRTSPPPERSDEVPLALPGVDGPLPVRAASLDPSGSSHGVPHA
jgi:hypothetical protein